LEKVEITEGITKVMPLNFIYYPFSHSLLAVLGWAVVFGLVYLFTTRYKRGAWVVGLLVLSHWLLDIVVHRADLPLGFSQSKFWGLGLWNYPAVTYILEFGILAIGLYVYGKCTTAMNTLGRYALYGFAIFLDLALFAMTLGPRREDVRYVGYIGNALCVT